MIRPRRDRVEALRALGRPGLSAPRGSPPASSRPEPAHPPEPRSCRRPHGAQTVVSVAAQRLRDADRRAAYHDLDRRGPATRCRPNRGRRSRKGFLDNDRGEGRPRAAPSSFAARRLARRCARAANETAVEASARGAARRRKPSPALIAFREDLRLLRRIHVRRRPKPVKTSSRRTGSGFDSGKSSVSDTCRTGSPERARYSLICDTALKVRSDGRQHSMRDIHGSTEPLAKQLQELVE